MAGGRKYENRTQEVSAISRGLNMIAKEMNVPLIALSQLSRAPESRTGQHQPQLSDLRESGSIEQDADVVGFIYRPEVYEKDESKKLELEGEAELIKFTLRLSPDGKQMFREGGRDGKLHEVYDRQ
jgi:replicative DNA helicase